MSILVNTQNEQEEKVILAFLDSLDIQYKTDIESDDQAFATFVKKYDEEIEKSNSEIENGSFVSHEDVELLFEKRRRSVQ